MLSQLIDGLSVLRIVKYWQDRIAFAYTLGGEPWGYNSRQRPLTVSY